VCPYEIERHARERVKNASSCPPEKCGGYSMDRDQDAFTAIYPVMAGTFGPKVLRLTL
jgi:hypothetical protein